MRWGRSNPDAQADGHATTGRHTHADDDAAAQRYTGSTHRHACAYSNVSVYRHTGTDQLTDSDAHPCTYRDADAYPSADP